MSHEDLDGLRGFRFHRQFIGNSLFTCSLTISRLHVYAICLHDNWSGGQNLAILEVLGAWYIIVHSDTMQRFVPNCAFCPGYASQKRITEARLRADRFWTHNLLFGLWDALEFASPRSALEKRKWIEMGVEFIWIQHHEACNKSVDLWTEINRDFISIWASLVWRTSDQKRPAWSLEFFWVHEFGQSGEGSLWSGWCPFKGS